MENQSENSLNNKTFPNNNLENQFQQPPPRKKSFPWLILFLIIALIGGAIFLLFQFYFIPLQVKEKAIYLKELFSNYTKTVDKIVDYMNEDSSSDFTSDSIKRSYEKGKLLIKEYKETGDKLKKEAEKANLKEMSLFVGEMKDYIKKAEELYKLTEDLVYWSEAFYPIYKDYEESALEMQGASNYLYSDPDKYTSILEEFLKRDKKIIEDVKKLNAGSDFKEVNELMAEKLQAEYDLFEKIVEAVKSRTVSKIGEAEKDYSKETLEVTRKLGAEMEKINDKIKEISRDIKSIKEKVDEEYNQLRNKHRF